MDTFGNELSELKGFVADLKADRAAQKEKEQRESWTKYTSMSIVFIAVLAAIATQWAGKYSGQVLVQLNKATLLQAKASDQWSYYQANSIKQNLYESIHELYPRDNGSADAAKREKDFNDKLAKYSTNKDQAMKDARDLETQREDARKIADRSSALGGKMGSAVSIFQISIAMGSICLVTKKKPLWYLSMLLAAFATFKMVLVWMS
jgi:hypothetical protein